MVLGSFDRGITHFDLANDYGRRRGPRRNSSAAFSAAIWRSIATKSSSRPRPATGCGRDLTGNGVLEISLASLDQSLKRMQLDYVDIFYSHRLRPRRRAEETMSALETAVRSGRRSM